MELSVFSKFSIKLFKLKKIDLRKNTKHLTFFVFVDVLEFTPSDDDDKMPFANECESLFYFYNSRSYFFLLLLKKLTRVLKLIAIHNASNTTS